MLMCKYRFILLKFSLAFFLKKNSKIFKFNSRNDSDAELELVRLAAIENGAFDAVVCYHYAEGGKGAEKLADALSKACKTKKPTFRYLYELNKSIEDKVLTIAKEMYGAGEVELSPTVKEKIQLFNAQVNALRCIFNAMAG